MFLRNFDRIYADTTDPFLPADGALHKTFGISKQGAVVVVRPDGYVGMLGRLDGGLDEDLARYFDAFVP